MAEFSSAWGNYLLKDIVEVTPPVAISWWPETMAWILVAVLIVLVLGLQSYKRYQKYQRNIYRREALACLSQWSHQVLHETATKWPSLLKKTAIAAFGRDNVAPLSGSDWECFLDACCHEAKFTSDAQGLLYQLSYGTDSLSADELTVIYEQIYCWVKNHRGPYD